MINVPFQAVDRLTLHTAELPAQHPETIFAHSTADGVYLRLAGVDELHASLASCGDQLKRAVPCGPLSAD